MTQASDLPGRAQSAFKRRALAVYRIRRVVFLYTQPCRSTRLLFHTNRATFELARARESSLTERRAVTRFPGILWLGFRIKADRGLYVYVRVQQTEGDTNWPFHARTPCAGSVAASRYQVHFFPRARAGFNRSAPERMTFICTLMAYFSQCKWHGLWIGWII